MNLMQRRAVVVAGLMAASFAGATAWRPTVKLADQRQKVDLEMLFPKAFGDWKVDDSQPVQLIAPDSQAVLSKIYNQTLSRTYVNGGAERIMLSVAYGGDQSDATRAHRPEVCYPAQGFQITASSQGVVRLVDHELRVRRMLSRLGGRVEPISYWITVGERVTLSGTEQKLAQLTYTIRGVVPDGMLVRVSSIDTDPQRAYRIQGAFITSLSAGMRSELRGQVFGTPCSADGRCLPSR